MSARCRKPESESVGIESSKFLAPAATSEGRFAFLDDILWTTDGMSRVRRDNLADDQEIKKHPDRGQLLLNGWVWARGIFNPSGHMETPHGVDVGSTRMVVVDLAGEAGLVKGSIVNHFSGLRITSRPYWYERPRSSIRHQTFGGSWWCSPLLSAWNSGKRPTTR